MDQFIAIDADFQAFLGQQRDVAEEVGWISQLSHGFWGDDAHSPGLWKFSGDSSAENGLGIPAGTKSWFHVLQW